MPRMLAISYTNEIAKCEKQHKWNAERCPKQITDTFAENTNGARARSGGLMRCLTYAIGANACIISIFSLYSGRSLVITKNAVVP